MAEKPTVPNSLELRGDVESDENLPNVPSFDSLTEEERQTLQLSVGHVVTLASSPQLPQMPQVVGQAARDAMHAPEDIVEQSLNRLSNTEMGQRLNQLSIRYGTTRTFVATADNFRARVLTRFSYADLEAELEKIFHESYDLKSLVNVHQFVAQLLQKILQELGPQSGAELCAKIIRCFLTYLIRDNLLRFVARLFRETNRSGGVLVNQRTLAVATFAAGLVLGSGISIVAGLLLRLGRGR